jgi:hypothetical protein
MEESVSGFRVRGSWGDVVEHGERITRALRDLAALRSGDDGRIRRAALRLAYRPHLDDVEDYNYQRALALLRDRGVAADLPIVGAGGDGA